LGCSSLCSIAMVILPLGWQLSVPWPAVAAFFFCIRLIQELKMLTPITYF
jgi:hypothetical protein